MLLFAGLLLVPVAPRAQVIINQAALDQLAGKPPDTAEPPLISAPPAIRQPRRAAYRRVVHRHIAVAPGLVSRPAPGLVSRPAPAPPVQAVVVKPATPPAPPKPQLPSPAIIDFAAGGADLPGNMAAMLKPFCAHAGGLVTIDAYAPADPADPSSAARLSLSRAFAIRDALTACGVPSSDIIPRANGAVSGKNPDAAELSVIP